MKNHSIPSVVCSSAALVLLAVASLTGCKTTSADRSSPSSTQQVAKTKPKNTLPDQRGDVAFQAFVGRLRKAVAAHDASTVADMMTPDFGYLLEPAGEDSGVGQGVFSYWEQNNLWSEVEKVLQGEFVPYGSYMVAPGEFASQEASYKGYRAGLRPVDGAWRFAYFVAN